MMWFHVYLFQNISQSSIKGKERKFIALEKKKSGKKDGKKGGGGGVN